MNIKIKQYLQIALALVSAHAAQGQYATLWSNCSSGGGASAGGPCIVSATIGQPHVSTTGGGSFSLTAGFWPGALAEIGPTLNIASSAGSVVLSWPASATAFHLQHCADLVRRNWVSNTTPTLTFGEDAVVVEPAAGARFYRLIKP